MSTEVVEGCGLTYVGLPNRPCCTRRGEACSRSTVMSGQQHSVVISGTLAGPAAAARCAPVFKCATTLACIAGPRTGLHSVILYTCISIDNSSSTTLIHRIYYPYRPGLCTPCNAWAYRTPIWMHRTHLPYQWVRRSEGDASIADLHHHVASTDLLGSMEVAGCQASVRMLALPTCRSSDGFKDY